MLCGRQTIKKTLSLNDLKYIPGVSVLLIFVISCYLSTAICTNTKTPGEIVKPTEAVWLRFLGYINKTDSTWQLISSEIFWYNIPVNSAPN